MSASARKIAHDASFQAFVNCYLREVDPGVWYGAPNWQSSTGIPLTSGETHVIELTLASHHHVLAVGVAFRSSVGRHRLTCVHQRFRSERDWRRLDGVSTQLLLIDAIYAENLESERRLELIGRVLESHQAMTDYVAAQLERLEDAPADGITCSFVESEQSIVLGHWLHPTPKSRQGIHGWQRAHYTPELRGGFRLHFFAADRAWVRQESLLELSAERIGRRIATEGATPLELARIEAALGTDRCLLPAHPLQAEWLLHRPDVRRWIDEGVLVDVGRLGPEFTPTSSVRTVYSEASDFMLKLSIPVKITNSLRINLASELGDSVGVSRLLRECHLDAEFPGLVPLEDPAYVTLVLPDREETGFEVVFRENPFVRSGSKSGSKTVHSIAALVEEPIRPGDRSRLAQLVHYFAEKERLSLESASRIWFDAYFTAAVQPVVRLYDRHGIALEAHQQNSLLDFDASGLPQIFYYRDIQGIALTESRRTRLVEIVPELDDQPKLFEPDEIVRNGLGYYLVFNQLYAVINRFGLDGLLDEESLLDVVRRRWLALLPTLDGPGVAFVRALLEEKSIPCKANLLTRVADLDELEAENELALYTRVDNPLATRPEPSTSRVASATTVPNSAASEC